MRRIGGAVALLSLALLLASCAVTPPVLGGPFPDGGDGSPITVGLRTDDDVAALLILNDPESPPGESTLADYLAASLAGAPATVPASCRDSTVPLMLLGEDPSTEGTVFRPPTLFREAPGADLLVIQVARRFDAVASADAFFDDLRAARAACAEFALADGSTVAQRLLDGDLAVRAAGFAVDTSAPDGSTVQTVEWVLVAGNVAISLRSDVLDEDDVATLRDLADEYSERLTE